MYADYPRRRPLRIKLGPEQHPEWVHRVLEAQRLALKREFERPERQKEEAEFERLRREWKRRGLIP